MDSGKKDPGDFFILHKGKNTVYQQQRVISLPAKKILSTKANYPALAAWCSGHCLSQQNRSSWVRISQGCTKGF
jgi:hypothetical protein